MPVLAPVEGLGRGHVVVARDVHDPHDVTDMLQTDPHVIRIVGRMPIADVWHDYRKSERAREAERERRAVFDTAKAERQRAERIRRNKAEHEIRTMQCREHQMQREHRAVESAAEILERDLRRRFDELEAEYDALEQRRRA